MLYTDFSLLSSSLPPIEAERQSQRKTIALSFLPYGGGRAHTCALHMAKYHATQVCYLVSPIILDSKAYSRALKESFQVRYDTEAASTENI